MATRVLVAMDGSDLAERALRFPLEHYDEVEVTALHVVGEPTGMMGQAMSLAMSDDINEEARERAQEVHQRAREIAAEYNAEIDTAVEVGHPARAIVDAAEKFDHVIIGSHSSTVSERLLVGNVAEKVFHQCPVPITIVR